jgi:isoquinoline 1-oxidoreductase
MEPERYELRFEVNRRDFVRSLGGGLLVISLVSELCGQESGRNQRHEMPEQMSAWLHIAADGSITVYTGKAEVGQNTRTSLIQAVAEELRTPVTRIDLVMADTARVPFDMGTFGSRSTPTMAPQLHRVGAAAREALLDLAAKQWGVNRSELAVHDGAVVARNRKSGFGELTRGQELVRTIAEDAPVTPATDWKICGTAVAKVNSREMVTGGHKYASDMSVPGMLYGKVVRPPSFGATLAPFEAASEQKMAGVAVVRERDFLAVAAADPHTAEKAAAALKATWVPGPQQPSSRELFEYLKGNVTESQTVHSAGSVSDAMRSAPTVLKQRYEVAYIAHTPLEPRAALAQWDGDKLTVYTGSQRPFGVRTELAEAFHLPEEKIRVIVPDTGAAYGGKHTGEAAVEAARIAKAAGKPVKVVWTREEEFTWAYARPAGVIEINSAAAADGTLVAWELHNYNSGTAGIRGTYVAPNERIEFHEAKSPLRQGSYRALAATANHFARESHMNELAHALKMDPVEFRLKNLKDERQRAVISTVAEKFGWAKAKPSEGRGFGIAAGFEKNGYVCSAAEVAVDPAGKVRVVRITTAFDCGAVVNPDGLKHQIEGAVIMGIGGALFESLQFENGRLLNPHLRTYRVPRFSDVPVLETVLIDRKDIRSAGAGESPIVATAPAIAAAIFSATGVRLRSMPLAPNGVTRT